MDEEARNKVAMWRQSVLGPLISARLEHGDRREYFTQAAARVYLDLDGQPVQVAARTIEDWFYAYHRDGLAGLKPKTRGDCGQSRAIRADVVDLILRAKREKPRRSIRRIIRMLERARKVKLEELSRSSVHRLLARHAISAQPVRGPSLERRSFLPESVGDLWVGDAMHGPAVIAPDGRIRKSYLLSQIDGASRYITHSYFALSEDAGSQEYGLKQSVLLHGVPRAYYVDLGSAYIAGSLRLICGELGIHLLHTGVKDCEAKGVIERWHRTWRDEVGDELPTSPLALNDLNAIHWAWLGAEYHPRIHDTTKRAPREHVLAEAEQLRRVAPNVNLDEVFLHRAQRTVRKNGTVRWAGGFLEVRSELCGRDVEMRFAPWEPERLPRVFVDGRFYCDTVPLDLKANNGRKRRRIKGDAAADTTPSGLSPLQLIADQHYRLSSRGGAPPAFNFTDKENE